MTASPLRSIALCADDFALHPAVDEAVERLLLAGRLSATSCMTTAPLWKQAAQRLPALRPRLSVGLHFNLTEGHGVQAGCRAFKCRHCQGLYRTTEQHRAAQPVAAPAR